MKNITYLLCCLLLSFCSSEKHKNNNQRENIEVVFIQRGVQTPITIYCSMIETEWFEKAIHYKQIDDTNTLDKFKQIFLSLSKSTEQIDIDSRIRIIYSHDVIKDTICMGEFFGISINGIRMNESEDFHAYVKKIIDYENTVSNPLD